MALDEVTDEWHDLLATDNPAIKELIEAAVVIEGGSVHSNGKISTGKTNSVAAYLAWMAPRIMEMKRILKPSGTLYLHCNHEANAYLRLLLDAVFERSRFRNEIIWCYSGGGVPKRDFARKHQTIFRYSKSHQKSKEVTFNLDNIRSDYATSTKNRFKHKIGNVRDGVDYGDQSLNPKGKHPDDWIRMKPLAPSEGKRAGWTTQKPPDLYRIFVEASSNPGDWVLDPFAGCGTTCAVAEKLGRRWLGIDIDPEAEQETVVRLRQEADILEVNDQNILTVRKSPPKRKDIEHISDDKLRNLLWQNQGRRCGNPYCTSESCRVAGLTFRPPNPKEQEWSG